MPNDQTPAKSVKTLAIRLEPELHAQLSLLAQLQGSTITDEIRTAIENHIEAIRSGPELSSRAESALEEFEREMNVRREALATLFGNEQPKKATRAAKKTSGTTDG